MISTTDHPVFDGLFSQPAIEREYLFRVQAGSVLWHGIIHQDDKTEAIPHRVIRKDKVVINNSWKQQVVGGMWVHWIQKGMNPEAWGALFVGKKRCLLRREEKIALGA